MKSIIDDMLNDYMLYLLINSNMDEYDCKEMKRKKKKLKRNDFE